VSGDGDAARDTARDTERDGDDRMGERNPDDHSQQSNIQYKKAWKEGDLIALVETLAGVKETLNRYDDVVYTKKMAHIVRKERGDHLPVAEL
jgi:murein L,D-transpeptidase YafK